MELPTEADLQAFEQSLIDAHVIINYAKPDENLDSDGALDFELMETLLEEASSSLDTCKELFRMIVYYETEDPDYSNQLKDFLAESFSKAFKAAHEAVQIAYDP